MPEGPQLPGVGDDDESAEPIVLHVDADCFYASCERLREPALRGEPVVVGMGYEPGETGGAVATASYEAREYGVESAQAISQALEVLPRRDPECVDARGPGADGDRGGEGGSGTGADTDTERDTDTQTGFYRPVDMEYYKAISEEVSAILEECADVVRKVSIDESYLDVTDRTAWAVADGFARHVKDRIRREVGVTVSVGVGPSMSVAKIASDFEKPDGLVVVPPETVTDFLEPLDISLLHGVGPVTARELRERGIETAGDLAAADPETLRERFGERGQELYDRARGADDRQVTPKGRPKSFSRESAFGSPVEAPEPKQEAIATLASAVADRARREGALYRTIGVKAVTPPFEVNTRAQSLSGPVDDPDLVERIAHSLFEEFESEPVRKLGVRVANLEFAAGDQTSLDGWNTAEGDRTEGVGGSEGGGEGENQNKQSAGDTSDSEPTDGQRSLEDFS